MQGDTIGTQRGEIADLQAAKETAQQAQEKLANWEPWMSALGRMLTEHRIARFPDDVLAWREERDAAESNIATLQQDVGRAEQELELANKDAAKKGALEPFTEQRFWDALGHQQEWLEAPQKVDDDGPVYMMRTQPGFIFDDSFWEVYQAFPFKICHVAYYGPERLEDGNRKEDIGVFELRFAPGGE